METIDIIKVFLALVKKDLDPYTTRKNVVIQNDETSVSLFTPSHIQFARYGRGPGKRPPLDPILEWVSKKGIIFEGTDKRGTAFAIQSKIGRVGTSNWVPNAPNAQAAARQKLLTPRNKAAPIQSNATIHPRGRVR